MLRRTLFGALLAAAAAGHGLAAPNPWRAPRTRSGAPDLDGTWTNATYTELERPKEFKTLVIGEAEARAWEAKLAPSGGVNVGKDELGQATSEFPETGSGMMRIRGEIRSSQIIEPEDGQIPYSEEGRKAAGLGKYRRSAYDHPEQRPQPERCLTSEGAGAPIFTAPDTNLLQIVQTPDLIVMVAEKYHDVRIVRLGAGPPPPTLPRTWFGESWGDWEGDTLVVRTAHVRPGFLERGSGLYTSGETKTVERFTRTAADEIHYEFTIEDPSLFTRPWRGELLFKTSPGRIFEYACHEGNYALVHILAAARQGRQPEPKGTQAAEAGP